MASLVRRYYLYRATLSAGFYIPVSVIYMEAQGLGLADIGFVQGAFLFSMVASELPTGYLGDRVGRRNALAFGNAIVAVVMVGFAVADSTADFTLVYVLWAVGWTFRTGTADAWLYELLAEWDAEDEHARITGRADSTLLLVSAGTALTASLLYTIDPAIPFLANAGLAALGLPLLATLPQTRGAGRDNGGTGEGRDGDTDGNGDTEGNANGNGDTEGNADADENTNMSVREAASVLRTQLPRPSIRWIVVYAALFNLVFSVTRVFEQPAMRAVGVPIAGLGVLYAGFKLISAVAASAAGPLQDRLGTRGVLLLPVPVIGIAYASFAVVPVLLVPALVGRRGLQQITRPVRNQYINDRLEDVGRATVLSGVSMALTLVSGTANVLGGRIASAIGPMTFLSVVGVAVSLAGGLVWVLTRPIREPTADAAPT